MSSANRASKTGETSALDISKISSLFLRSYNPKSFDLPPNTAFNFSPFVKLGTKTYAKTELWKAWPLTFMRHRFKDMWLYVEDNKPVFKTIQRDWNGFAKYTPPQNFFIEYLEGPTFILYTEDHMEYGNSDIKFIVYSEMWHYDSTGKPDTLNPIILVGFTTNSLKATRFSFNAYKWSDYINNNTPAHSTYTGSKNVDYSFYNHAVENTDDGSKIS